jgi:RNA polymerase sigma-70 factor (ECF subfamily)
VPSSESAHRLDERFRAYYTEHASYVFHSLRRLGVHEADREDLVHDVFITAFRRIDSYDHSSPLRAWLFGIAYRKASDYRRLARHQRETSAGGDVEAADLADGPEEQLRQTQQRRLIFAALEKIEFDRRAVFVMHDIDEVPVPVIAGQLGLPVNTAYSRLRLARSEFEQAVRRLKHGGDHE